MDRNMKHLPEVQELSDEIDTWYQSPQPGVELLGTGANVSFIPSGDIERYFASNGAQMSSRLIRAVFEGRSRVTANDLTSGYGKKCCILVRLKGDKIRFLDTFVRHPYLCDDRLPFISKDAPAGFPHDPDDDDFYKQFCEMQWQFCPPLLYRRFGLKYPFDAVMPFARKDHQGKGSTSNVYSIVVPPLYDKLVSQPMILAVNMSY
jgi:hypothetical protein